MPRIVARMHHDNVAENAPASACSIASSQSRSRVDNMRSSRRKSRVESVETMEEEWDEHISES